MSGAPDPGGSDRELEMVREVTARAIRRLEVLEYVTLAAAAVLALVAGALTALLLGALADLDFRWTWAATSLLFFVVPALAARWRDRDPQPSTREEPRPGGRT